jgi:hypothetical protein
MMSGSLNSLYNSWLYLLLLHVPFSSTGPKIYISRFSFQKYPTVFHPILTVARSQRHRIAPVLQVIYTS